MFENIKEWFNPESKPPLWAQGIQSILTAQDVVIARLRTQVTRLEEGQALLLKQIDNDALVVAKLNTQLQEMDHCLSEIVQFGRNMRDEQFEVATEVKPELKVGDKVRVCEMSDISEEADGKTGRITSTRFSELGTGAMLCTVRFPRKIHGSAIHEFYDDEIEFVEE